MYPLPKLRDPPNINMPIIIARGDLFSAKIAPELVCSNIEKSSAPWNPSPNGSVTYMPAEPPNPT